MRIITGIARGRRLASPAGENTRPTSDRVKESLFNIIQSQTSGAKVLDLFAGTGSLGLEALSRGAGHCIFIEKDKAAYKILRQNIEGIEFDEISESYNQEAANALKIFSKRGLKFDIIFLDPPYGKGMVENSISEISRLGLGEKGCLIVSESDLVDILPEKVDNFFRKRVEKYGRTIISFWLKEE